MQNKLSAEAFPNFPNSGHLENVVFHFAVVPKRERMH